MLEPLRIAWNLDTPDEQCGAVCGRRWAATAASPVELQTLAEFSTCPGYLAWLNDSGNGAVITPERLVDIIGGATRTKLECVNFWNLHFGDSDRHAAIWRTPEFLRGFISGVAAVWNDRSNPPPPGRPPAQSRN